MGSRMLKNDLNDLLKRSKNHSYKDIKGEGVSVIGMETCKVRYDLENLESGIQDEFKKGVPGVVCADPHLATSDTIDGFNIERQANLNISSRTIHCSRSPTLDLQQSLGMAFAEGSDCFLILVNFIILLGTLR